MKHRVVRIEPLSAAKTGAVLYGALGLLVAPLLFLMALFRGPWEWSDFVLPLAAPLLYGVMGAMMGAAGSWCYNLAARWIGGIEVTTATADSAPPMGTDA